MNLEFSSQEELYQRVKPALYTKKCEMIREGYSYITEEDIWNYFKEEKWINAKALLLHDLVNDIINTDSYHIDQYFKSKLSRENRKMYFNQ